MDNKRKISKNRLQMGEEAWSEYQRQRKNNKSNRYRLNNSEKVISSRRKKKKALVEYKGGKCERCGLKSEICDIYDFHHIDPNKKEFGISQNGKNFSLEKLKVEADKCLLVCKNCHAVIHYEINQKRIHELRNKSLLDFNSATGQNLSYQEFTERKEKIIKQVCTECKEDIKTGRKRCKICHEKYIDKKYTGPTKDQLIEDLALFKNNKSAIARKYNVSSTSVSHWIKVRYKL
jgi:hypothetical protein